MAPAVMSATALAMLPDSFYGGGIGWAGERRWADRAVGDLPDLSTSLTTSVLAVGIFALSPEDGRICPICSRADECRPNARKLMALIARRVTCKT